MRSERDRRRIAAFLLLAAQSVLLLEIRRRRRRRNMTLQRAPYRNRDRERNEILRRMYSESDEYCYEQLRIRRAPFRRLCVRLRAYGLSDNRQVKVEEAVAIFLHTTGHDLRNRMTVFHFFRSGHTISRYFHQVLSYLLMLYTEVVNPVTSENSPADQGSVESWHHHFQDAVGAIDCTYINANVPVEDHPRYRNGKNLICQNVFVACTFDMKFTYVLAGWEGSADDRRILRSAMSRNGSRLTLPPGKYYLADARFSSVPQFLTPYRNTRYRLQDFVDRGPENAKELFNFRHSSLRHVVQQTIRLLKKRFAYLRHQPFHDIATQSKIVLACCTLHNFLREQDPNDMCSDDEFEDDDCSSGDDDDDDDDEEEEKYDDNAKDEDEEGGSIIVVPTFDGTNNRDIMANVMYVECQNQC